MAETGTSSKLSSGLNISFSPTLLVIDDDDDQLFLYATLLESKGYDTVTATSAEEGLGILEQIHIDLVVCDVHMPGMNGKEFVTKVRKTRNLSHLPVIEFSVNDSFVEYEILDSGADVFCPKWDTDLLLREVDELLNASEEQVTLLRQIQDRFNS